jgi:hypothetical protein
LILKKIIIKIAQVANFPYSILVIKMAKKAMLGKIRAMVIQNRSGTLASN